MSPKLRTQYPNLPRYVTVSNGRVVYRPRVKHEDRAVLPHDKHGYYKPPIRLGKVGDPEPVLLQAYIAAKQTIDAQIGAVRHTVRWIVAQYMDSRVFKRLAGGTQDRAKAFTKVLDHPINLGGRASTFGELNITAVTKPMVRRLADKRMADYQERGRKGGAQVNQEINLLRTATHWAMQHIDDLRIADNPFVIDKEVVGKNERYVTDDEYLLQCKVAAEVSPPWLLVAFELTYLLACRGAETIALRQSHVTDDGVVVNRLKGSRTNLIEWSDRLREAVAAAHRLRAERTVTQLDPHLINGARGPVSGSGLQTTMQKLKKAMTARGVGDKFWNLHLLKSKGMSDAEDKRISGHRSEAMRDLYTTNIERVRPAK